MYIIWHTRCISDIHSASLTYTVHLWHTQYKCYRYNTGLTVLVCHAQCISHIQRTGIDTEQIYIYRRDLHIQYISYIYTTCLTWTVKALQIQLKALYAHCRPYMHTTGLTYTALVSHTRTGWHTRHTSCIRRAGLTKHRIGLPYTIGLLYCTNTVHVIHIIGESKKPDKRAVKVVLRLFDV